MNKYKKYIIPVVSALFVCGIVLAANKVYQHIENYYESSESEEAAFSGVETHAYDFTEGFKIDDEWVIDRNNINYYNISVDGTFDGNASTTGDSQHLTFAYWSNPYSTEDLIIEDLYLDVYASFDQAIAVRCGTTTPDGTLDYYPYKSWGATTTQTTVIASSTLAAAYDSSKSGFVGIDTHPGTSMMLYDTAAGSDGNATTTKFILEGGDTIICAYSPYSATSTPYFDADNNMLGSIRLKGKAYMREE